LGRIGRGVIGTLIGIIITLIILGVIWWAIEQLLPLIPLPEPFLRIIRVLLRSVCMTPPLFAT
jgi:hypothetical protein